MLTKRLTFALALALASVPAVADDGVPVNFDALPETGMGGADASDFRDDPSWKQIVIRGDAAWFLFVSLSESPEALIERTDGTTFRVRSTPAMGCSRSDLFGSSRFLCVSFVKADGTTRNGVMDPEYGGMTRIGVGN